MWNIIIHLVEFTAPFLTVKTIDAHLNISFIYATSSLLMKTLVAIIYMVEQRNVEGRYHWIMEPDP